MKFAVALAIAASAASASYLPPAESYPETTAAPVAPEPTYGEEPAASTYVEEPVPSSAEEESPSYSMSSPLSLSLGVHAY